MRLNDARQLRPGLEALVKEAGQPSVILIDKGYDNTREIAQVETERKILVLCPPQRRANAQAGA